MVRNSQRITALIGGQYGSEGKGVISAYLAPIYDVHVRVGGPNAGHTFKHKDETIVMQTIPCGWVNYKAFITIGAGGMVQPDLLFKEIDTILRFDPYFLDRFVIDAACGVITQAQMDEEGGVHGEMHQRIGSTGKGVGTHRRDRLMRDPSRHFPIEEWLKTKDSANLSMWQRQTLESLITPSVAKLLYQRRNQGDSILLEGTQGSGLSLVHGPWPYVTSGDTNAAQICADAGLPPTALTDTMLVARTYPIRVAGNSGPMRGEVDWEYISAQVGKPVTEKTTVTKKIRRVAMWDETLIETACILNNPSDIAITFMDYLSPEDEGKTEWGDLSQRSKAFVEYVETRFQVRVPLIGTGGEDFSVVDRRG